VVSLTSQSNKTRNNTTNTVSTGAGRSGQTRVSNTTGTRPTRGVGSMALSSPSPGVSRTGEYWEGTMSGPESIGRAREKVMLLLVLI
jgi:hypothetical protein